MTLSSPLVWVGGKSSWASWLVSLLPPHGMFVEVFGGGGSVLLAKQQSTVEVYNDLDDDLVNLFRVIRESPDEFRDAWRYTLTSRSEYERLQETDPTTLDPVRRAWRYLYLNRCSFSGDMAESYFAVRGDGRSRLASWMEVARDHIDALALRLRNTYIEHMDFRRLIPQYDRMKSPGGTVFFLDPPYLVDHAPHYNHWMYEKDHRDLRDMLSTVQGNWLMTINDCPEYREWYKDCRIMGRPKQYSKARQDSGRREFSELIISNYDLPQSTQMTIFG